MRHKLLIFSLAIVFIIFGVLKVFEMSPVRDFVVATTSILDNTLLFRGLGVFEVILGLGLLFKLTRRWAALLIIMHLAGIFALSLLRYDLIFSSQTILTLTGEFVLKNLVLIAAAFQIFREKE